ncbi:MAG: YaiO family outer membrane beta-barrel protein [Bacteroidetes bacterium]|nr:YaiO family outer membrane beta-barrel protein [Bacteroidota bacterium]
MKGAITVIKFFKRMLFLLLILFFSLNNISAQKKETVAPEISIDSLFAKARQCAYNDQKALARSYCRQILSMDNTYYDASVLIGRTYSWEKQYDSAKYVLKQIIDIKLGYYDAMDALIDVELWSDDYAEALKYANIALAFHPNDEKFLFKKAKSLNFSENTGAAINILLQILNLNPSNKDASNLLFSIKENKRINKVGASYDIDAFTDGKPWHYESIYLSRKTKIFGTVIARFNIADRFDKTGNQFEIDAYPSIRKGTYLYFNTGYSGTTLYPKTRLSLEVYQKLPEAFEFSLGFRYMNFDDKRLAAFDSSMVMIYTGTIGKYLGNYWFSFRPYLTPGKKVLSKSFYLTARRYLKDADNYLSLTIGTGFSPDDHKYAFATPTNYFLKSQKFSLSYQQKLFNNFISSVNAGVAQEEFYPGIYRNRYSVGAQITYSF